MLNSQNNVVSRMLCPSFILHTCLITVCYPTKARHWLVLETTENYKLHVIGLHLKNELLTLTLPNHITYMASSNWLPNLGPFQTPPLGLIPLGRAYIYKKNG